MYAGKCSLEIFATRLHNKTEVFLENVFYLENKGLIDVGKYNVLQKLFSEDNGALSEIEKVSKLIENTDPSTIRSTGMFIEFIIIFKNSLS